MMHTIILFSCFVLSGVVGDKVLCPANLSILEQEEEFELSLNETSLDHLSLFPKPFFLCSTSGAINTGKTTTTSISYHLLVSGLNETKCPHVSLNTRNLSKAAKYSKQGLTRGLSMVVIPRALVNPLLLPQQLRTAFLAMHESPVEGSIVFIDVAGNEDLADSQINSNLLSLMALILSSHHTISYLNRVHDLQGIANLAREAQFLRIAEKFSGFNDQCLLGLPNNPSGPLKPNRPKFDVRVKDGRAGDAIYQIECLKLDKFGNVIEIPPSCSLFVPVLPDVFFDSPALSAAEKELVIDFFGDSSMLIQPIPENDEQLAIWDLHQSENRSVLMNHSLRPGIVHSIFNFYLPQVLKSMQPLNLGSQSIGDYVHQTWKSLNALAKSSPRVFSEANVKMVQHAVLAEAQRFIEVWENKSATVDSEANLKLDWTVEDILATLPLEIQPKDVEKAQTKDDLCPSSAVRKALEESFAGLLKQVCIFRSVLSGETETDLQNQLDHAFARAHDKLQTLQRFTCSFAWHNEPWSVCSGACPGTQTRNVSCKNSRGDLRSDRFCFLATQEESISLQDCDPPVSTYKWVTPGILDWPTGCPEATSCSVKSSSDLVPAGLLGGFRQAAFGCEKCGVRTDPQECLDELGSDSRPQNLTERCFVDQPFFVGDVWTPQQCECRTNQTRKLSCTNCYGETLPLQTCIAHGVNRLDATAEKPCSGYEWRNFGNTSCSGSCGVFHDIYKCFPCQADSTDKTIVDDSFCSLHPKPSPPGRPCEQQYNWVTNSWPTACVCQTTLSRKIDCVNKCTNEIVQIEFCFDKPSPANICQCGGCPTGNKKFLGIKVGKKTKYGTVISSSCPA